MNNEKLEQDEFTDEEMEDFTEIFTEIINRICIFSDKHNFDRDNILKYFSLRLDCFTKIATIKNFRGDETC